MAEKVFFRAGGLLAPLRVAAIRKNTTESGTGGEGRPANWIENVKLKRAEFWLKPITLEACLSLDLYESLGCNWYSWVSWKCLWQYFRNQNGGDTSDQIIDQITDQITDQNTNQMTNQITGQITGQNTAQIKDPFSPSEFLDFSQGGTSIISGAA